MKRRERSPRRKRICRPSLPTKWWTSLCRRCAWAPAKLDWLLEQRHEMPAALEEVEEAETEGILMHPGFGPKRVLGRDGKVVGLECLKTKQVFDENRRFNPVFHDNSETQFDCDTIILAIGQAPNLDFLRPEDGVMVSPRGLVNVNRDTLMTSAAGVFAGGDCAFGPRLIIDSVGDGKRAAIGIDEYLQGAKHPEPQIEVQVLDRWQMAADYMNIARQPIPMVPLTAAPALPRSSSATANEKRCPKRSAV